MNQKKPDIVLLIYKYKLSKEKEYVGRLRRRLGAHGYAINLPVNLKLESPYIV